MGRKPGKSDAEDEALWQIVTRTVRPFNRKKPPRPQPASPEPSPVKMRPAAHAPPAPRAQRQAKQAPGAGLDAATRTRLKKGRLPIDARLDLHGLTQEEAYAALRRFIRIAAANRARTLLVITGKGRVGGGVLRRMVPLWLEEPDLRNTVLTATPAKDKDGGEGALYVRLRNPDKNERR